MHFDAPFVVLNSRTNWGEIRRIEQRDALKKIINYIKENNIKFLFVAGDLYENELIRESTIKYINDLFKQIPNTKVFISPGNHDPYINNSYYKTFQWAENVIIFSQNQKVYETSDADIYGIAFTDFYCKDLKVNEIKINNKEVEDSAHLKYEIYKYKIGKKIKVTYTRNDVEKETNIVLK